MTSVLEALDDQAEAMMAELSDLVAVPSISGSDAENEALDHLAHVFVACGLDVDHWQLDLDDLLARPDFPGVEVERREAWGLVGRLAGRGGGRHLMFNGHVDVVPPGDPAQWPAAPFVPTLTEGRLGGRGTCDMKAGLVAALWATSAIRAAGVELDGDIVLAAVLGEEDGGLGTYATLARGWRADACVIPEPTDLDIVPGNAGSLTFRLTIHGLATHAARRTEGVSAIDKLVPVLRVLRELEAGRNADVEPLARRWSLAYPISVGTVHGGDWASSVPDRVVAEGRLGVMLDEDVAVARVALEGAVAAGCAEDPWLVDHPVSVEWWGGQFASGRLPADSDLAERVGAAHHGAGGGPQRTWIAPYGSDLRLMTGIGGVPTVQYGPGDVALAHGPHEHVVLDDVRSCARTLATLAVEFCTGPR
ncbi:MAG: ArgE/DapE family deacylase [Acidimicrobiia bacterium]|nr:ArgE/DapE family deacylase [Acidimicrobiia bacterium]